jgi:hypothetical protein
MADFSAAAAAGSTRQPVHVWGNTPWFSSGGSGDIFGIIAPSGRNRIAGIECTAVQICPLRGVVNAKHLTVFSFFDDSGCLFLAVRSYNQLPAPARSD